MLLTREYGNSLEIIENISIKCFFYALQVFHSYFFISVELQQDGGEVSRKKMDLQGNINPNSKKKTIRIQHEILMISPKEFRFLLQLHFKLYVIEYQFMGGVKN